LCNDKWEWISGTGPEMTAGQLYEEQRKQMSEKFETETKRRYSKTNEAIGVNQESGNPTRKQPMGDSPYFQHQSEELYVKHGLTAPKLAEAALALLGK
jgi:hypothetical protein